MMLSLWEATNIMIEFTSCFNAVKIRRFTSHLSHQLLSDQRVVKNYFLFHLFMSNFLSQQVILDVNAREIGLGSSLQEHGKIRYPFDGLELLLLTARTRLVYIKFFFVIEYFKWVFSLFSKMELYQTSIGMQCSIKVTSRVTDPRRSRLSPFICPDRVTQTLSSKDYCYSVSTVNLSESFGRAVLINLFTSAGLSFTSSKSLDGWWRLDCRSQITDDPGSARDDGSWLCCEAFDHEFYSVQMDSDLNWRRRVSFTDGQSQTLHRHVFTWSLDLIRRRSALLLLCIRPSCLLTSIEDLWEDSETRSFRTTWDWFTEKVPRRGGDQCHRSDTVYPRTTVAINASWHPSSSRWSRNPRNPSVANEVWPFLTEMSIDATKLQSIRRHLCQTTPDEPHYYYVGRTDQKKRMSSVNVEKSICDRTFLESSGTIDNFRDWFRTSSWT